jgi:ribosomal protein L11 methyltransferase
MPLRALTVTLNEQHADAFSDALMEAGAVSVNVEDADVGTQAEKPIFGEPGAATGLWQHCRLTALFAEDADAEAIARNAASILGFDVPALSTSMVEDIDWVQQNRDQFQPIQISSHIWIVPTWHSAPDAHAINIALDPGAAFGTGSHPTTRLCLQWLEECMTTLRGRPSSAAASAPSMLDYGTGSGILAIAAKKLGAGNTVGVDIDAQAIEAARYNARQNGTEITFSTTETPLEFVADITVANILANPLKVLAPLLASHTRSGGMLAMAGILDEQADDIIRIYAPYFALKVWRQDEGWSLIAGVRT